jgi:cysteine-rich repeat protein
MLCFAGCKKKSTGGGTVCGDGILGAQETCDDENRLAGDGCSDTCQQEDGWLCDGEPSVCVPICGDALVLGEEECDATNLDGESCASLGLQSGTLDCLDTCMFDVTGCDITAQCGNGAREYPEQCDATDLAGETCLSLGFNGGTLACLGDCTYDVSACEFCGNGVQDTGEECDGDDLAGESCQSLGYGQGQLGCAADCWYDASGCDSGPTCGDGNREPGEQCDGQDLGGQTCESQGYAGGILACAGDCTFDFTNCETGPVCGNGVLEQGEDCDTNEFPAGVDCVSLGHDGGDLLCTANCTVDQSQCIDCVAPFPDYCAGSCVNTDSDPDYCGDCITSCGANQICVGGQCVGPNLAWTLVGTNPIDRGTGAVAHDLATEGTQPTVAWVTPQSGGMGSVLVATKDASPQWRALGPPPNQGIVNMPDPAVALTFAGTVAYVMFGGMPAAIQANTHVMFRQGNGWQEVGAPGYASGCMSKFSVDFALDGVTPHITTFGAGGCGTGIDYAWWDGNAWQVHPTLAMNPGQLTMNGIGNPAIVFTDQAYIGVPSYDSTTMATDHTVMFWDSNGNAWADLVGPLDENAETGQQEHMSMTADGQGNIYAAWSENTDATNIHHEVYVKMYSVTSQSWSLVGSGRASGPGSANHPSITLIGGVPWLAYIETSNTGDDLVTVRRYESATTSWPQVGLTLNEAANTDGFFPVIVGIGGVPYVAFREGTMMSVSQSLYVKHYVVP